MVFSVNVLHIVTYFLFWMRHSSFSTKNEFVFCLPPSLCLYTFHHRVVSIYPSFGDPTVPALLRGGAFIAYPGCCVTVAYFPWFVSFVSFLVCFDTFCIFLFGVRLSVTSSSRDISCPSCSCMSSPFPIQSVSSAHPDASVPHTRPRCCHHQFVLLSGVIVWVRHHVQGFHILPPDLVTRRVGEWVIYVYSDQVDFLPRTCPEIFDDGPCFTVSSSHRLSSSFGSIGLLFFVLGVPQLSISVPPHLACFFTSVCFAQSPRERTLEAVHGTLVRL